MSFRIEEDPPGDYKWKECLLFLVICPWLDNLAGRIMGRWLGSQPENCVNYKFTYVVRLLCWLWPCLVHRWMNVHFSWPYWLTQPMHHCTAEMMSILLCTDVHSFSMAISEQFKHIIIYGSIWLAGLGWTCHMSVKAWVDQYARNVKLKYLDNPFSLDNTSFTWFTAHFFCCLDESTWCHVVSTSPALYLSCCGPRKEDISGAFWWTRASKM